MAVFPLPVFIWRYQDTEKNGRPPGADPFKGNPLKATQKSAPVAATSRRRPASNRRNGHSDHIAFPHDPR
jgi:hypothetical protein